jgi:hypothetical protein
LKFTSILIDLELLTNAEALNFLNQQYVIPAPSCGTFPLAAFIEIFDLLELAANGFWNNGYRPYSDLYQCRVIGFLLERLNSFLLLSYVKNNSLKIVAISGLMSSALSLIAMPKIGSWLDRVDRLKAAKITLFYKLTAVSLAYLLCAYLNHKTAIESLNSNLKLVLFYILPILYSIAGVSFATITQQIETDWIVVISNKDKNWLRITNAFLSQIDLGCKALAPAVTGLLFAKFSQSNVSFLLVGFSTLVTIMFYQFIDNLYHKFPNLANKV